MRRPEEIGSAQILLDILFAKCCGAGNSISLDKSTVQISARKLYASEKFFGEFLIDGHSVTPCRCAIGVVEELVKSCHLGWFDSLICYQSSLKNPERRRPNGCVRQWIPRDAEFWVELLPMTDVRALAVRKVTARPESNREISQRI